MTITRSCKIYDLPRENEGYDASMRKKTITVTKTDKVKKRKKVPQTQTKQVTESDLEMSQYSVHT